MCLCDIMCVYVMFIKAMQLIFSAVNILQVYKHFLELLHILNKTLQRTKEHPSVCEKVPNSLNRNDAQTWPMTLSVLTTCSIGYSQSIYQDAVQRTTTELTG